MERIVVCRICGSLVLQQHQAQHDGFHQRHGHVTSIDFSDPVVWLDEKDVERITRRRSDK